MPSTFQYWTGAAWATENNKIEFHLNDTLGFPMSLDVTISNPNSQRETSYGDYTNVRLLEDVTQEVLFRGKVEKTEPIWIPGYGQCVKVYARDALQELQKRPLNRNYNYAGLVRRADPNATIAPPQPDGLINRIVRDHVFGGSNISVTNTVKFSQSPVSEAANVLNSQFRGSRKNALYAIQELSANDPWTSPITGHGFDYYIDTDTTPPVGIGAVPDMHYFLRGTRPLGGAVLTIEYNLAAETNTSRIMLTDYSFDTLTQEKITQVRCEYVDSGGTSHFVTGNLIFVGAITGGPFTEGEQITSSVGGEPAARVLQQGSLSGTNYLVISADPELDTNWSGSYTAGVSVLTGTTSGAFATFSSSFRQTNSIDVEQVISLYGSSSVENVRRTIASTLTKTSDASGIVRGQIRIVRWPRYRLTGTHTGANNVAILTDGVASFINNGVFPRHTIRNTADGSSALITARTATTITGALSGGTDNDWDNGDTYTLDIFIRAGMTVRVVNSNIATLRDMVVEEIDYSEGPGQIYATIKVFDDERGIAALKTVPQIISMKLEDSQWQSAGALGDTPRKLQPYNTNVIFEGLTYRTLRWTSVSGGLTNGTITWGDGTTQTVTAANSAVLADSTTYYAYIDSSTDPTAVTLVSGVNYGDAVLDARVLIAIIIVGTSGSSPTILPFYSRQLTIGAVALAAEIVLATTITAGISGGARVELSSAGIRAYNATPTQTLQIYTSGLIEIAGTQTLQFSESIGGGINGYLYAAQSGGVSRYILLGASGYGLAIGAGVVPLATANATWIGSSGTAQVRLLPAGNIAEIYNADIEFPDGVNNDSRGIGFVSASADGSAANDDLTKKRVRLTRLAAPPAVSDYIAFTRIGAGNPFYLILEDY